MSSSPPQPVKKIVVLGGGSAGFLAALGIARGLPKAELVVIRSTKMGVIGVGEGTIPSVVQFLHRFLNVDFGTFQREVHPSIKLGIKYLWGQRPFFHYTFSPQLEKHHPDLPMPKGYFCQDDFEFADLNSALMRYDKVGVLMPNGKPRFNPNFAYHLENQRLVAFFEKLADERGINKIDAILEDAITGPEGIRGLRLDNGEMIEGDLFIDASGFRAELLGKVMGGEFVDFSNALFCDRAVVGGWERGPEDRYHPYTTAETMEAGWAWQIEHDELVNRGYVFCSNFLSDEQAIEEFCRRNPKVFDPRVIQFRAGVYRDTWLKNVVAVGNAAGFVEPIEATAIGVICDSVSRLIRGLSAANMQLLDIQRNIYNRIVFRNWEIIRDFIALHYKFNNRIDSPFWSAAQQDVELGEIAELVDYYRAVGPDFGLLKVELKRDFFTAEGYLAMLLGQSVPYDREVIISEELAGKWSGIKQQLTNAALNGATMEQYLAALRSPQWMQSFGSGGSTEGAPAMAGAGSMEPGELNWHQE